MTEFTPEQLQRIAQAQEHFGDSFFGYDPTTDTITPPDPDTVAINRGTPMTAAIYTSDPNRVTAVIWPIASERVSAYNRQTDEPIDGPNDATRMEIAIETLVYLIQHHYPNCTDVYVSDGGPENQLASFAPRAETDDGSIYEPFLEDMTAWEDKAIAHAWSDFEF